MDDRAAAGGIVEIKNNKELWKDGKGEENDVWAKEDKIHD